MIMLFVYRAPHSAVLFWGTLILLIFPLQNYFNPTYTSTTYEAYNVFNNSRKAKMPNRVVVSKGFQSPS